MAGNRHKITVGTAKLPDPVNDDGRFFNGCCEEFEVFANLSDDNRFYNDLSLLLIKLYSSEDVAEWKLIKDGEEIAPVGVSASFTGGQFANAFVVEWRRHLQINGEGCYKAVCNYTISGIEGVLEFREFHLQHWNADKTEGTVRLMSIFDDYSKKLNLNFSGSGCVDTIRFGGEFGRMKPNATINNLTSVGSEKRKVKNSYDPSHTLKTDPLNFKFTDRILREHLLEANEIFVSDHNRANHNQSYRDFACILRLDSSVDTEYFDGSNLCEISAEFDEKISDNESQFPGRLSTNNKVILEMLANAGGGGGICEPADITLNGNEFISVPSGGADNITLIDADGNTISPNNVSGSQITINIPPVLPSGTYTPKNAVSSSFDLLWQGQNNVVTGSGSIQRLSAGGFDGSSYATVGHYGDLELRFVFEASGVNAMFGFDFYKASNDFIQLDFAIYKASDNTVYAYENGVSAQFFGTFGMADTWSLKRIGNTMNYMRNGSTLRTVGLINIGAMNIDCSLASATTVSGIQVIIP